MERKVSVPLYLVAFVVTAIIFALGIYVGALISQQKEQNLEQELTSVGEQVSSAQLLLLLEGSPEFCPVYTAQLASLDERTDRLGYKLNYLEETQGTFDRELKQSYFVLEAQAYLLSKKVQEKCDSNQPIILYFYSNERCDRCRDQGAALLDVKQAVPLARIYSFDGTLDSPIVDALKAKYNVSVYPTLVINERAFENFQPKERVLEIIQRG